MGREFELKFRATAPQQDRIFEEYPISWREIAMETTYFDTPDASLGRLHWTLRRRMENGVAVCTVKTPSPDGGRGEWELETEDLRAAIPELCKLGAPKQLLFLAEKGLQPVCGARFTRRAGLLELEEATVELALDRGCLTGGGGECPLCEVEVEVKSGSEAAAIRFAGEFARKFALEPEGKSKYRRALDLAKGE